MQRVNAEINKNIKSSYYKNYISKKSNIQKD